jgi:hypothetical protein
MEPAQELRKVLFDVFGGLNPHMVITFGKEDLDLVIKDERTGIVVERKTLPFFLQNLREYLQLCIRLTVHRITTGISPQLLAPPEMSTQKNDGVLLAWVGFVQRNEPGIPAVDIPWSFRPRSA